MNTPDRIWLHPAVMACNSVIQRERETDDDVEYVRADARTVSPAVPTDYRAGMLHAAKICKDEFSRAPMDRSSSYMSGYEDACDHLTIAIEQAAVIDCTPVAAPPAASGALPEWSTPFPCPVHDRLCKTDNQHYDANGTPVSTLCIDCHHNNLVGQYCAEIVESETCLKCGHSLVNAQGQCRQCIDWERHVCEFSRACGCRCVFGAPDETCELRSECCNAPTRTANTDYNVCTACKEACSVTTAAPDDAKPVGEVSDTPERIRVCIRAGREDWVGVAYANETSDPSKIHEYVRANLAHKRCASDDATTDARERVREILSETNGYLADLTTDSHMYLSAEDKVQLCNRIAAAITATNKD